jgi:hypothetical protein
MDRELKRKTVRDLSVRAGLAYSLDMTKTAAGAIGSKTMSILAAVQLRQVTPDLPLTL